VWPEPSCAPAVAARDGHIEVRKLNHRFDAMRDALHAAALDEREYKRWRKAERKGGKGAPWARCHGHHDC
jgi:hypothetical protein